MKRPAVKSRGTTCFSLEKKAAAEPCEGTQSRAPLTIRTLSGPSISIDVSKIDEATVYDVMCALHSQGGFPPDQQRLVVGGRVLGPMEAVADIAATEWHLVLRLGSGGLVIDQYVEEILVQTQDLRISHFSTSDMYKPCLVQQPIVKIGIKMKVVAEAVSRG